MVFAIVVVMVAIVVMVAMVVMVMVALVVRDKCSSADRSPPDSSESGARSGSRCDIIGCFACATT